eukprot:PITA_31991
MAEHAVMCKFMGMWPAKRAYQWIRQHWKPRGDVKLHLGAKGFFTVMFTNLEDKDRIFDGGPYFMASTGLYMRPWKPNFVPEKESFTQVLLWIRLFSLPIDYWGLNALKKIGDQLGTFIKASKATLQKKYTSYARICVEMDVSGALNTFEILDVETDSEETQKTKVADKETRDKEEQTKKEEEEDKENNEIQMREQLEEPEEDTDMLTSDGGSEDIEMEEDLARAGLNLPIIVENLKNQGIETASEE